MSLCDARRDEGGGRAALVEAEFRSCEFVFVRGGGSWESQVEVSEWTLLGCPGGGVMEEGLGLSCQLLLASRWCGV